MLKICSVCKLQLSLDKFAKRKKAKDGLNCSCKSCKSIEDKKYRLANKDKIKERKQLYYITNKNKISNQTKQNYYKNKEERLNKIAEWKRKNKEKVNFSCAKRRAAKLSRNIYPEDEYNSFVLEEAYILSNLRSQLLKIVFHVDHIVPLMGKTVNGLHVADNIQIIPASENCSKRADYWPNMW